ncbi:hypothetical protein I2486_09885 [Cellulophaga sp. E16_2]|uniref:hypothetical protein n=1 Tax=Cellulophaga sp. E16_2 TaxID=2789297 RepID=UPI001A90FDE9|nr:hypothetical protein [Cellulophaga sp. E16_2]MBO0591716.1 hypothetical protein [Cellulophaga sp. E16_2]
MRILILLIIVLNINCIDGNKKQAINDKQEVKEYVDLQNGLLSKDSLFPELRELILPFSHDSIANFVSEVDGMYGIKNDFIEKNKVFVGDIFNEEMSPKSVDIFFYNIKEKGFYPIFKYSHDAFTTVGSLVKYFGGNDIPGVFFILTNFNKNKEQIDYLIVYNRFLWEINYEYNFLIDENFKIHIDKKEEFYYDEERGDFINDDEEPEVKKHQETYIINNKGIFVKSN